MVPIVGVKKSLQQSKDIFFKGIVARINLPVVTFSTVFLIVIVTTVQILKNASHPV